MTPELLINIAIGVVLVGLIAVRQLRWRRIDRGNVWRLPAVLGIVGVVLLGTTTGGITVGSLDIGLIALELVISIGIGLLMGRLTTIRVAGAPDKKGNPFEARAGGVGVALWIVFLGLRIGIDVIGAGLGAQLLTGTGVILLSVAANRAASALVIDSRLPRATRVAA
jgi:hypothetical protein